MAARDGSPPPKRCRICGEEAETYRERNIHEASHYTDGEVCEF